MDYKQKLPDDVQAKLDAYIERIKIIKWFQPDANLKKEDVETKVKIALNAFGIKGSIEYKQLKTSNDWDAARGAARDAAQDAAQDVAWGAARDVAWDAARDVARDVAWGAVDLLVENLDEYKKKYPNGNFINLIPLWEMGLYPIGLIDGKFVIYIPALKMEFPNDLV